MPKDYVTVVYNQEERPITDYPDQLTRYLATRYSLEQGKSLLDLGCGRGDFLNGFIRCGLKGYGVDQSLAAQEFCPGAEVIQSDIENSPLPYKDNQFDYIFSKSVVEHFYYPEQLAKEILRILKPGGLAITMTPDWDSVSNIFFNDYTHRTPFTVVSLLNLFTVAGFNDITVKKFRQLPFLWTRPWLEPFSSLISSIAPSKLSPHSKLVRFSKEVMLLASAVK